MAQLNPFVQRLQSFNDDLDAKPSLLRKYFIRADNVAFITHTKIQTDVDLSDKLETDLSRSLGKSFENYALLNSIMISADKDRLNFDLRGKEITPEILVNRIHKAKLENDPELTVIAGSRMYGAIVSSVKWQELISPAAQEILVNTGKLRATLPTGQHLNIQLDCLFPEHERHFTDYVAISPSRFFGEYMRTVWCFIKPLGDDVGLAEGAIALQAQARAKVMLINFGELEGE